MVHGQGPLLICPAWWVSHLEEDWSHPPFRRFFEALARHHTVVRYDRPGVGLSGASEGAVTLASEVALLGAVFDHLGRERASLLAISCAAPPSLVFAARRPQSVQRLALYGAYLCGGDIATRAVQEAMLSLVRAHWGIGSRALADIFHPGLSSQELDGLMHLQRAAADAETAALLLQLTYDMDAADVVGAVRCPTLVVHRRKDRAIPFEAGRRLAAALPDASFISLEGRIHPAWGGPDDVLGVLEPFLSPGELPPAAVPVSEAPAVRLDRGNRELVVEGRRLPLTPLEHGLLSYLEDRRDRVVTRDEALRDVWEQPFGGSNVVDAVVRSLRKKLGPFASRIETVKGHGYRFRSWPPAGGGAARAQEPNLQAPSEMRSE